MFVIYKIVWQDKVIYIGSTEDFKTRIRKHRNNCYNENLKSYKTPIYKFIRDNCEWRDLNFGVVEEILDYNDKSEIKEIEGEYIKMFWDTCMNVKIENRTPQEYMREFDKSDKRREYRQSDKYKKYLKEYDKSDKRKEYKKEYEKSDKRKEYKKQYYLRKLAEKRKHNEY